MYQIHSLGRTDRLDVLLPGERLNARLLDERTQQVLDREKCIVAWVMDPDCGACKRLAQEQGRRVRDVEHFYWLFAGSDSAVSAFVTEYGLSTKQILRIRTRGNVRGAIGRFGIMATPTRIIAAAPSLVVGQVRVMDADLMSAPEVVHPSYCSI
jgi:hypothetical protein